MSGHEALAWPLSELAIELTTTCNLSCSMCSVWEGRTKGPDTALTRDLLTAARALGATSFVPCGAECFTRADFVGLLEHAQELGYTSLEVVTNGLLVGPHLQRLERLPALGLHISLDGPAQVHDALRGEGVYERAVDLARQAVARGIRTGFSGVLMKPTLATAHHLVDLAVELGMTEVSYQPFQPEIDGWRDSDPWSFVPEERPAVEQALSELRAYAAQQGVQIYTEDLLDYVPDYVFEGKRPIPPGGCFMPSRFLLVDVHGDVYPCFFMRDDVMGNLIRGDTLGDIWHGHVHLALQALAISERCPGCLAACSDVATYACESKS